MTDIALFGNPNTGKTTLFNQLTDNYANVGNWTGVTVEKKAGHLKGSDVMTIDLPGVYSLNPITKDEAVAVNYLLTGDPKIILNVTNASQLRRNLLLSIELLEFGKPVVLVLNMIDDLERTGVAYDLNTLSQSLHCDIQATNARNHEGVTALHTQLITSLASKTSTYEHELNQNDATVGLMLPYPSMLQPAIKQASAALIKDCGVSPDRARWIAIQYMNKNKAVREYANVNHLTPLLAQTKFYDLQNFEDQIFQTRLTFIETTLTDAQETVAPSGQPNFSKQIDTFITNPILGLPIFILIFYLMFKLSFDWIGTPLSNLLDAFLSGPVSSTANHLLVQAGALPFLQSLIVDGIIAGVGGVLTFMPQIFVLFACISLLEDSGYMARAALVTDRIMEAVGLNGKAFIPLIIGFGCNVTGIMAARTIEQPKERLITTLISPFMSCSARLPIYGLFVAAFFQKNQALIILSLYFLGIAVALILAKAYQLYFHTKENTVFIVELPQYHMPRLDIICHGTWDKGKGFIKKAGTVIFGGTVLIWVLSNFGPSGFTTNVTSSFSAILGQSLLPIFRPLGTNSWEVVSALLSGILAKEVIGSSLMVLLHTTNRAALIASFAQTFTPLSAYALLVFVLLYIPCFATIATIKAETGSTKITLYSIFSSFAIAYTLSLLIYQIGSLIMHLGGF